MKRFCFHFVESVKFAVRSWKMVRIYAKVVKLSLYS